MWIKFIQDHFSGITEGRVIDAAPDHAQRWIDQKFAIEATAEEIAAAKEKAKQPDNTEDLKQRHADLVNTDEQKKKEAREKEAKSGGQMGTLERKDKDDGCPGCEEKKQKRLEELMALGFRADPDNGRMVYKASDHTEVFLPLDDIKNLPDDSWSANIEDFKVKFKADADNGKQDTASTGTTDQGLPL